MTGTVHPNNAVCLIWFNHCPVTCRPSATAGCRTARYAGQVTNLQPDSITLTVHRCSQAIAIPEIQGLRRISAFNAAVRRSSRLVIPEIVGVSGDVVGGLTKERAGGTRLLLTAGTSIGAGVLAPALIRLPPLKKAKTGYSFRAGN